MRTLVSNTVSELQDLISWEIYPRSAMFFQDCKQITVSKDIQMPYLVVIWMLQVKRKIFSRLRQAV